MVQLIWMQCLIFQKSMQIAYGETENVLSMESDRAFTAKYVQASRTEKTDADFGVQENFAILMAH